MEDTLILNEKPKKQKETMSRDNAKENSEKL